MQIIKASGDSEKFTPKKIYYTIKEAGGSDRLAKEAVREVRQIYHKNITTKEVLDFLTKFLKKENGVSQRYNLKKAIMSLGPTGFPFESFFARILEYYGYTTQTDQHLRGTKIIHEVDIIAQKEKKSMIECKYHNQPGTSTSLHPAMYTYARFLDLSKYNFDFPWLVTNTKCSQDAINYALGVNLKITSWNYPENESILRLIENKKIYPITISNVLKKYELEKFYELKLVVANDVINKNITWLSSNTGIPENRMKKIIEELKIITKQ
jgi:hypothetical protein